MLNQTSLMQATIFFKASCILGEGPIWHASRQSYFWVDIEGRRLHEYHPPSGNHEEYPFDKRISLAVIDQQNNLVIGLEGGIYRFDLATKATSLLAEVEPDIKGNRCNDGKADKQGRLWFGTMGVKGEAEAGAFYCLDTNMELKLIRENMSIPNGMAWFPEKRLFYNIDTPTQKVESYRYDDDGNIQYLKTVIEVPSEFGSPDGMCIDTEGRLWIAHWGGYGVYCWNPDNGELLEKIEVPAANVTSCVFGGERLDELVITTATDGVSEEELKKYPDSGSIFMARPRATGMAAYQFYK